MAQFTPFNHLLGFTLIELLLVLLLMTVLLMLAVPLASDLIQRNQTEASVWQLFNAIQWTRQQAIERGTIVVFCGSQDGKTCSSQWSNGQLIKILNTDTILRVYSPLSKGCRLFWKSSLGKNDYLAFAPSGKTYGQNGRFIYYANTKEKANSSSIAIIINQAGRIRLETVHN